MVEYEEGSDTNFGDGAFITIDVNTAIAAAQKYDYQGRDFAVDIIMDLGIEQAVNFVSIDPVLFDPTKFTKVLDVATAGESSGFETVEGFSDSWFDKTLTTEANKELPKSVQAVLGPTTFNYSGQGVFSFPKRNARKIRISIIMEEPISSIYERLHVLVQEKEELNTTVSSKKKKGFFCWVAREIYGENDIRWIVFREWMLTSAPIWFIKAYLNYGERFATYISDKPRIKSIIKLWMNKKIKAHG
jgi:hypothetical protein